MDDLASTLSQILGNPEAMNQLKSAAAALGLGDMAGGQMNNQPQMNGQMPMNGQPQMNQPPMNQGMNQNFQQGQPGGMGFPQGGMGQQQNQGANPMPMNQGMNPPGSGGQNPLGNLDLSALGSVLGSLGLGPGQSTQQPQQQNSPGLPSIDMGTLMKIQGALSRLSQSDKNVDLLMALKPHLSEERSKKVDDAVKIMQLIKLLPLIKESGLFGGGTP